ncbi:hypothetical protein VP01_692g2 [Puccinia sorghi]|uniref:Uncharacterized protein n=1 Tax=Puccinia sorghi TaxID=27349 RepID=A0A0L6UGA1_9BASI|nr:hypothetical protein VP01_692g2 [Puccinia sorghi]
MRSPFRRKPVNFPGLNLHKGYIAILKSRPSAMFNMPTPSIQSTQPTTSAMSSQKRPGLQRGFQGYSGEDCTALEAMTGNVSTNFTRISPSKTTDSRATLSHRRLNSSRWLCRRSPPVILPVLFGLAFVGEEDDDYSADEINGVGNPVLPPSDVAQTQSMLGTQLSAWSETQCNVNLIELDANDPDGADLLQSPGLTSHTGRSIAKQTRPIAKRNRSLAKHRTTFNCLFQSLWDILSYQQLSGRHSSLPCRFFDPEAWKTCDMKSSMLQFYVAQLQEATTKIKCLQDNAVWPLGKPKPKCSRLIKPLGLTQIYLP